MLLLGRMEGKLDSALSRQDRLEAEHQLLRQDIEEVSKRVGRLETWRGWIIGAGTIISGVIAFLSHLILGQING